MYSAQDEGIDKRYSGGFLATDVKD